MPVEFGVLIPTREAIMSGRPETGPLLAMAERAEAAGFDSVWIGDSITAKPRHEPLTLMAAIAARTRRVRHRHRRAAARAAPPGGAGPPDRDRGSPGRGPGDPGRRHRGRQPGQPEGVRPPGVPWERRVGRFLETIEICRALWQRDNVSFAGKHFTIDGATVEPKPHRPGGPPIWIGGDGPTALREAARFDAWFPTGPGVEFFAEKFPGVQAAARAAGRAPDAVTGAAYVTLALDPSAAAAEQRLDAFLETLLRGARAGAQGAPGHVCRAHRGRGGVAPALDRRRRAPHGAALRGRRSARPGGRSGRAPAAPPQAVAPLSRSLLVDSRSTITPIPPSPTHHRRWT